MKPHRSGEGRNLEGAFRAAGSGKKPRGGVGCKRAVVRQHGQAYGAESVVTTSD